MKHRQKRNRIAAGLLAAVIVAGLLLSLLSMSASAVTQSEIDGLKGQATDIQIQAEQILRIKKTMNELLAQNTGKPLKTIERDVERDHYLTAEAAKDYGLIDEIIAPRR